MSSSSFSSSSVIRSFVIVLALFFNSFLLCNGGKTSIYVRKEEKTVDMPLHSDVFQAPLGYNAPQQVFFLMQNFGFIWIFFWLCGCFLKNWKVHITQGDHVGKAVIVSWVAQDEPGSNTVVYWSEGSKEKMKAVGKVSTYKYYNYTSGFIHHCTVKNLEVNFWIHSHLF